MINDYLTLIMARMEGVKPLNSSSHLPADVLEPIEKELLLNPGYSRKVPEGYALSRDGIMRIRRLKNPTNAHYLQMPLRIGTTTLHIEEKDRNLEAILLCYLGGMSAINIGDSPTKAYSSTAVTLISLLENGVVSASYMVPPFFHAVSMHPEGMERFGGHPYPNNAGEVSRIIEYTVDLASTKKDTRAFRALPTLVMFAIDTCRRVDG
jgi:hypothetical protein